MFQKIIAVVVFSFSLFLSVHAQDMLAASISDSNSIFLDLSNPSKITIEASLSKKLNLIGELSINEKQLKAELYLENIDLSLLAPITRTNIIKKGNIKKGQIILNCADKNSIESDISTETIVLENDNFSFETTLNLKAKSSFPSRLDKTAIDQTSYSIEGKIINAKLAKLPIINSLSQINGEWAINQEKISLTDFTAQISPENIPVKAKGELNLDSLLYSFDIESDIGFKSLSSLLSKINEPAREYNEKGNINLKCNLTNNEKRFQYSLDFIVSEFDWQGLTTVTARGSFQKDNLNLKKIALKYKDIPLEITGNITNWAAPKITLALTSDLLNIQTEAKYNKGEIHIPKLNLSGKQTNILANADITAFPAANIEITGYGTTEFGDIRQILNLYNLSFPLLSKLDPKGNIATKFKIEHGAETDSWKINLTGESNNLNIYGVQTDNTTIAIYRDENELILNPITAVLGTGKIELGARLDYLNNFSTITISIDNIDLKETLQSFDLKQKDLSGKLFAGMTINNLSSSQWDKLDGTGRILIKEGNIWQINILHGLGKILNLPNFENITFKEAYTDLIFKENNIFLNNTRLYSPQINLQAQGQISLKGDLKMSFYPQINPNLISESDELKQIIAQFLGQTLAVQIEGNIANPSYSLNPIAQSPIKTITNALGQVLESLPR